MPDLMTSNTQTREVKDGAHMELLFLRKGMLRSRVERPSSTGWRATLDVDGSEQDSGLFYDNLRAWH
ncbi:hypothetical protein D3C77_406510 [compost metagenome]